MNKSQIKLNSILVSLAVILISSIGQAAQRTTYKKSLRHWGVQYKVYNFNNSQSTIEDFKTEHNFAIKYRFTKRSQMKFTYQANSTYIDQGETTSGDFMLSHYYKYKRFNQWFFKHKLEIQLPGSEYSQAVGQYGVKATLQANNYFLPHWRVNNRLVLEALYYSNDDFGQKSGEFFEKIGVEYFFNRSLNFGYFIGYRGVSNNGGTKMEFNTPKALWSTVPESIYEYYNALSVRLRLNKTIKLQALLEHYYDQASKENFKLFSPEGTSYVIKVALNF